MTIYGYPNHSCNKMCYKGAALLKKIGAKCKKENPSQSMFDSMGTSKSGQNFVLPSDFLSFIALMGAQWLSGRVLDSRPRGCRFEPHRCHCVVVLEQDTFILA